MLVDIAEKLTQKLMREGQLSDKQDVLIRQMNLKFGLEENEKNLIRKVQESWLLDAALDAIVISDDKSGVLGKLRSIKIDEANQGCPDLTPGFSEE